MAYRLHAVSNLYFLAFIVDIPPTGTSDANGIVEDMSLTTVKVRNFDNTIVTISPTTLVNGSFQNWIGMQKRSCYRSAVALTM